MNDDRPTPPRRPEPPERPASEDGHEHHGVVETLRDEIEEVVEHVPEPVRWTVGKLARLASLVLVGVIVLGLVSAVLYFMNRTELVARELSLLLNRTLHEHSDLVLDLRDIRGNPLTGFRAIEPRVKFQDGSTVLEAHEMRVNYSAWSLLSGGDGSIDVVMDHPLVRLVDAKGAWRLPTWHSGPSKSSKLKPSGRVLQVRVNIHDATVTAPRPYGQTTGLDAVLLANTGASTRIHLDRMSWTKGPWNSRLERLTADLSADTAGVRVRVGELRSSDLELRAEGDWAPGQKQRQVHLAVGRVRWRWLAEVFDNRTFDVAGDGAFVLDAAGDRDWRGRFRTTLDWGGLAVDGTGRMAWKGGQLTLDSLLARSEAGELSGALHWSETGWDVLGDARHADPAHWQALHIAGWPHGELNGWFRYAVETRGRPAGMLEAKLVASDWQGWHADSARVRLDFPPAGGDSFSVVAMRRGGEFVLHGHSGPGGWGGPFSIRSFPLDEWPDGRATKLTGTLDRASGLLEDRAGALYVTGEFAGSATRWSSARFANWTLEGVRGRLLPKPDLTAQAHLRDGFFSGIHLDSAAAPIVLGDRVVRFLPLTAQAGDTTLAMTGQVAWDGPTWWMTVSAAEAGSRQYRFVAEPPVRLSGDAGGVVFERLIADDHEGHVEVRGRWAAPGGPYDFELTGEHLDLARVGLSPEWGVGGRAELKLTVQGRSGDPRWRLTGRAHAPAFAGHAADSLSLVLSGAAHRIELEDARFDLGGGSLRAAGAIESAPAEFPDSLTATALLRWLRDAGTWRAHAAATGLPVAPLASLAPAIAGWDGSVSGTLALSGSPARPVADVDAHADQFGWRDIRAERVDLRAHYADGRFQAQDLRASMQHVVSTAHGSVPLKLALGVRPEVPDEPVSGGIDIPAGDLQVLPFLVPQLQSAHGRFDLSAEISGTTHAPHLSGKAHIRDGIVRPINRSEVLEGLGADLHFDQSRITLDTLWAKQGGTGHVWSKGAVQLDKGHLKGYRFDLAMRDFAASDEGLYALLLDGDFVVSDGPRVGGERLPQVSGQARIKKGVIEFDFANQSEVQRRAATTQPLYWTYRIRAEATSNLRWRPQDADIEFNAGLDLQQTSDSLIIFGEMHSLRGTYWFLSNRFNVVNADLTFDNQNGVDPLLDIGAQARVRPKAPSDPLETITAQITGRASKPVISLASNSGWEQRQILAQLTLGTFQNEEGRISATDPLDSYFTRQLNAQLSAGLSEFFKGAITDWELQRDQGGLLGTGALVVGVGSQVTDRLAFRYSGRLPGLDKPATTAARLDPTNLFEQNVEAEYRINRFIFLTSGVSRRRNALGTTTQPNTDYNLNLKAHWEY